MTQKLPIRFNEKDPFGVGSLIEEAPNKWFPNSVKPQAVGAPILADGATPVAPATQAPGASTLIGYAHQKAAEAASTGITAKPAVASASSVIASQPQHPAQAVTAPLARQPEATSVWVDPASAPQPTDANNAAALIRDAMKLQLLRGMFPQHEITPVEHDPFAKLPEELAQKVDVNAGVQPT